MAEILLTGATGFLGRYLIEEFSRQKMRPLCLVRPDSALNAIDGVGFSRINGDVTNPESLNQALKGIEILVHAAGLTGSADAQANLRINYQGALNLISACQKNNVKRAVIVSSISAAIERRGPYGDSKLMADNAFLSSSLEAVIIRPTLIFGQKSKQIMSLKRFASMAPFIIPVIGDGNYRVQPVAAEDVARLVVAATLKTPPKRLYGAGGPAMLTFNELMQRVATTLGQHKSLMHLPYVFVHGGLKIAGNVVKNLPINAAQVATLCQDAVCPIEETQKDFQMDFTALDTVLSRSFNHRPKP